MFIWFKKGPLKEKPLENEELSYGGFEKSGLSEKDCFIIFKNETQSIQVLFLNGIGKQIKYVFYFKFIIRNQRNVCLWM